MDIWPIDFLDQIRERNRDLNKPVALVLTSAKDGNGALTNHGTRFFLLTLSKTHRVFLETIQDKANIPKVIHQTTGQAGRKIQLLIFNAHGSDNNMELGGIFTEKDLTSKVSEDLDVDAIILCESCHTGKKLGPKISNLLGRAAWAPMDNGNATDLYINNQNEIKAINPYQKFYPNGFSLKNPCTTDKAGQDSEYLEYIKQCDERGDLTALTELIIELIRHGAICEKSGERTEAEKLYRQAVNQSKSSKDCASAKIVLGVFLEKKGEVIEAEKLFSEAEKPCRLWADQGNDWVPCLFLGSLLEKRGNLTEAEYWFRQTAKRGEYVQWCTFILRLIKDKNVHQAATGIGQLGREIINGFPAFCKEHYADIITATISAFYVAHAVSQLFHFIWDSLDPQDGEMGFSGLPKP